MPSGTTRPCAVYRSCGVAVAFPPHLVVALIALIVVGSDRGDRRAPHGTPRPGVGGGPTLARV